MPPAKTIAIDGPAASGKSTVGKLLADELGYLFFDTGVMYRAITWAALQREIDVQDEEKITTLAQATQIDIRPPSLEDGRNCDILADGSDVTWQIRCPEVDANVSLVSSYPGVRHALTKQQRRIGLRGEVVMLGRDIGTVVLPEAEIKIYLDASVEERAQRRYNEIISRGGHANQGDILNAMRKRDQIDSTRAIAPLRPAEDAVTIDSDNLTIGQVVEKIIKMVNGIQTCFNLNAFQLAILDGKGWVGLWESPGFLFGYVRPQTENPEIKAKPKKPVGSLIHRWNLRFTIFPCTTVF